MIDISKIRKSLPDCELSEIRPCATPGKVQFHLLVSGKNPPTNKIIDITQLAGLLEGDDKFKEVKSSTDLGVVKAGYGDVEISALASGRVVVKKADDEEHAQQLLEVLAPLLKKSIF